MDRFTNKSPGALTMEQAIARHKKSMEEYKRQLRQARALAAQGRGEDTEIAHVALGELVVPRTLQSPEVIAALQRAAAEQNIPLEMLRVGNAVNRINPNTGQPEFGIGNWANQSWSNAKAWANRLPGQLRDGGLDVQAFIAKPFEGQNPSATILPPGGAPMTAPTYQYLNYDPNGPNRFMATVSDPFGAVSAAWHAGRAWHEAKERYEGGPAESSLHNGEGDSWKHARWNQRMANSIGTERAKAFADWNERKYANANPVGEQKMDLVNNQIGRSLVGDNSTLTIDELVRSGRLRTRPY